MLLNLIYFVLFLFAISLPLFFRSRIKIECTKHGLNPPGQLLYFFRIFKVWDESNKPGREKLRSALIGELVSFAIWLLFMIYGAFYFIHKTSI